MEADAAVVAVRRRSPLPFMGVSRRKRSAFYTQVSRMLEAGIGPVRVFTTMASQGGSWRLARAARDMAAQCQSGATLGEAFARHPNLFPPDEVRVIDASSHAGHAPIAMLRIARLLDRIATATGKVLAGLIYPGLCLFMAFAVLPLVISYFTGDPKAVLRYQGISAATLIGGALVIVTVYRLLAEVSSIRVVFHAILLHVPLFGKLFRRLTLARFSDTFQALYAAGVMIPEAMSRAAAACGNAWVGGRIARVAPLVKKGMPVSQALARARVLPVIGLNLIQVGEQVGELDATLLKFAEYQHNDLEIGIERLTKILPTLAYFLMILILAIAILSQASAYVGQINKAIGP